MIDGTLERAAQHAHVQGGSLIEAQVLRSIPMRRFAEPSDIADAVVFLAGRRSAYITGQVVTVDGGMKSVMSTEPDAGARAALAVTHGRGRERMASIETIDENLLSEEAVRDPHVYFARVREFDPVYWNAKHRAWVLTRDADVARELRSQVLTAERISPFVPALSKGGQSSELDATFKILEDWLVFRDPPEHTRLRRLVARAFTPSVVRASIPDITLTIEGLVADLRRGRHGSTSSTSSPTRCRPS